MSADSTTERGPPRILLVGIDDEDAQRIRELLDGAIRDEVIQRVEPDDDLADFLGGEGA